MEKRLGTVGVCLVGVLLAACGADEPPRTVGGGGMTGTDPIRGSDASAGDAGVADAAADGLAVTAVDAPMSDDGGGDDAGADVAGTPPAPTVIGPAGGQLTGFAGRVTVIFPRGSILRPTRIELAPVAQPPPGTLGAAFAISPAQEPLAKPARIVFSFAPQEGAPARPNEFRIGRFTASHWNELGGNRVDLSARTVTAELPGLGVVALLAGVCRVCTTTCTAETCMIGGQPGKCFEFGNGCRKCVPTCDADGDGFCPGGSPADPRSDDVDDDINVSPESIEVCGNAIDDDGDGHNNEGCKACSSDADCTVGKQACIAGACEVCEAACDPATCRFGADQTNPGVPGRCFSFGVGCSACVPDCDADGDGYCPQPEPGMGRMGGDCHDGSRGAHPGAAEICGNGIDDDCNGVADDKCVACNAGSECPASFDCVDGACEACKTTCDPAACRFGSGPGDPGIEGKCVAYGKGCSRCAPKCDGDGDGHCPGNPDHGQPGGDCRDDLPAVFPAPDKAEICANEIDDNCNGHTDEGCQACTRDAECLGGSEACVKGVCDLCPESCEPATCRFGFVMPDPMNMVMGNPGVPGRCVEYGTGCRKCVPACDKDADGYCPGPTVMEQMGGDCLDDNPAANPAAPEVCGNMIDDDCDGRVDEACAACTTAAMCAPQESCSTQK